MKNCFRQKRLHWHETNHFHFIIFLQFARTTFKRTNAIKYIYGSMGSIEFEKHVRSMYGTHILTQTPDKFNGIWSARHKYAKEK